MRDPKESQPPLVDGEPRQKARYAIEVVPLRKGVEPKRPFEVAELLLDLHSTAIYRHRLLRIALAGHQEPRFGVPFSVEEHHVGLAATVAPFLAVTQGRT